METKGGVCNRETEAVAILTPALNEGEHLPDVYASLVGQSSQAWEWFVSDNCSDDDTHAYLESLKSDSRVHWIRHGKRLAAEDNWQSLIDWVKALDHEYIMFLAGDDWLADSEALQSLLDGLRRTTGGLIIGPVFTKINPTAMSQTEIFRPHPLRELSKWQVFRVFLGDWGWCHLIYACYRRQTFFETFNPKSKRLSRDSDWLISLGAAVRDPGLEVLSTRTLIRRVGDPQSVDYYARQRGKIALVRSRTLAQLLIYARKLIWPIFVYIPNGLRFFSPKDAPTFVLAMFALWSKNVFNLVKLPFILVSRLREGSSTARESRSWKEGLDSGLNSEQQDEDVA